MMLVSIVIPCFNSAKFVREAVLSAVSQTYKEIEVLCVDNGSTDDTLEILQKLNTDFPQIKIFHQPIKGAPAARNLGIKKSSGEIIQFLDSDDVLEKDKIEKQVAHLIERNFDIVVSDRSIYDSELKQITRKLEFGEIESSPLKVAIRDIIITGNPIYRKALFEKHGNWDESLNSAQDWELNIRMAIKGARFGYLAGSFLKCRSHSESLSYNWINVSKSGVKVIEKWQDDLLESTVLNDTKVQNKIFYCFFDVAVFNNDSQFFALKMKDLNIPMHENLSGINKFIARIFGIKFLIKLKHKINRR